MDDGGHLLDRLRADPRRSAVLLDFDGTLAPIVDDPARAVPIAGAPEMLRALGAAYGVVAVISGRPVAYLEAHLPAGPTLVGLYGLEATRAGVVTHHPEAARWRGVVDDVAAAAVAELPAEVVVEHKGLSLTLHARVHPDRLAQAEAWAATAGAASGLHVRRARMSVELHPPLAADKGTAVDELLTDAGAACFIGDDVGDLPAFDALDRFSERGGAAVRVVVRSTETDPTLLARADLVVAGPAAVLELLGSLLPD